MLQQPAISRNQYLTDPFPILPSFYLLFCGVDDPSTADHSELSRLCTWASSEQPGFLEPSVLWYPWRQHRIWYGSSVTWNSKEKPFLLAHLHSLGPTANCCPFSLQISSLEEQTGEPEGSSPQSEQCLAMFSDCLVMLLALETLYKEYLATREGDKLPASGFSLKSPI